jgi:hypothetical protein
MPKKYNPIRNLKDYAHPPKSKTSGRVETITKRKTVKQIHSDIKKSYRP